MKEHIVTVDYYKLMRWFNIRKLTPVMVAERSGVALSEIEDFLQERNTEAPLEHVEKIAGVLNVPENFILKADLSRREEVLFASAESVLATKREVFRDSIHFYNYYSWPSPKGYVAPVILDILCPAGRLPALNNGHLEAAITINLGPGDIYGRWAAELNDLSFRVLKANRVPETSWILGETYTEPCYCPHAYSLVDATPAQILSYTAKSEVETLFTALNDWPDDSFQCFADKFGSLPSPSIYLAEQMDRHGYDTKQLAAAAGIETHRISAFAQGDTKSLPIDALQTLAQVIGFDYRLLLETSFNHDAYGKVHCTVEDAIASIRPFKSYTAANMAHSAEFPDLSGLYMKVEKTGEGDLDLCDPGNSHYGVTAGDMVLQWMDQTGHVSLQELRKGDALWVGPYIRHAFSGKGALIKMTNGENISYLHRVALSNTREVSPTLKRSRKDNLGWGYDKKGQ